MSYTDARLVTSALAGDPRSVEELVLKYQRRAYAVARAIGLNAAERLKYLMRRLDPITQSRS